MKPMRGKRKGTWEERQKRWRMDARASLGLKLDTKITDLEDHFGVAIPPEKGKSEPYWRIYRDEKIAEAMTQKARERLLQIRRIRIGDDPFVPATLTTVEVPEVALLSPAPAPAAPKKERLVDEIETYIDGKNGRKQKSDVRRSLDLFAAAAGDISVREIDVDVYRRWHAKLISHPVWGEMTQHKSQKRVDCFLTHLERAFSNPPPGLDFRFRYLPQYRIAEPEGPKVQWTLEQVQTALDHATGIARIVLLTGLNFGWSTSDLAKFDPADFDGTHVCLGRTKLDYLKKKQVKPVHLVWAETATVLAPVPSRKADREFKKLRDAHNLPEQSDLRKTVQQLISDEMENTYHSLLYRGVIPCEDHCHKNNYHRPYTEKQIASLDAALARVHDILFKVERVQKVG